MSFIFPLDPSSSDFLAMDVASFKDWLHEYPKNEGLTIFYVSPKVCNHLASLASSNCPFNLAFIRSVDEWFAPDSRQNLIVFLATDVAKSLAQNWGCLKAEWTQREVI